jgi:hypothetical protein
MRLYLWDLFWDRCSKQLREAICAEWGHSRHWFGIETLRDNGNGFCACCAWGAYSVPFLLIAKGQLPNPDALMIDEELSS